MANGIVHVYQSPQALAKGLAVWQRRLRMQDWDFDVQVVRTFDIGQPGVLGTCGWNLQARHATIQLLDPIDYDAKYVIPYDAEVTLVHEMLHAVMARMTGEGDEEDHMDLEIVIDQIARALVEAHRK